MTQLATLDVEPGETTIVCLAGELDSSNAPEMGGQILESVTNRCVAVLVDLRETSYLDSSGVQLIFDLAERLKDRRQHLHLLIEGDSFVAEVLRTVAVIDVAQVHTELAEALRSAESEDPPRGEH